MEQPPRVVHQSTKGMWVSKFILRLITFVFALVVIAISATIGVTWLAPAVVFFIPPAIVSAIWNIAEGICILVRGGHRGIHPGACIGVDLILWLGFLSTSSLYILLGYAFYWNVYPSWYDTRRAPHLELNRASVAFGFLLTLLHFVLFVIACVETSMRSRSTVVIVQQPPHGMVFAQGYSQQGIAVPPQAYYPQHQQHQSMVIPQGYKGPMPHEQQDARASYPKPEADSTPVSPPPASAPLYDERRP